MANEIRLKRGSGSDPGASDLVVGEVAVRTDNGTLFTKKDDGNVAEIGAAAGVSDGDKGDIVVSNSGSTFLIDSGVIDNANVASNAAIAGSKIDPTFTSTVNVTNNLPEIFLTDSNSSNARARINANGGGLLLGADNDNAHANSSISFQVDGSNKMFINSSGKLGIGTSSPTDLVDILNTTNNSRFLRLSHPTAPTEAAGFLGFNSDGSTNNNVVTLGVQFSSSYYNVLNIKRSTRAVGIGTVNPSTELDVNGTITCDDITVTSTAPQIDLVDSNANSDFRLKCDGGNFHIEDITNAGNRLSIDSSGDVIIHNDLDFPDNSKIKLGAGDDLTITHDGSHSRISDTGTGSIKIETDSAVHINKGTSENMAKFIVDGQVELYFDNSKKLSTASDGITVTGRIVADELDMSDNDKIKLGSGDDLQIYHDGSNSYVADSGTGGLLLSTDGLNIKLVAGSDHMAKFIKDGAVELYHDNTKRIETTSSGASITGNITVSGTVDGRDVASDGTKLDGIESGATADQTASDIKTLLNSSGLVNAQIDASAAIAGSKINPAFTSGYVSAIFSANDTDFSDNSAPGAVHGIFTNNSQSTNGVFSALSLSANNSSGTNQAVSFIAQSVSGGTCPNVFITQRTSSNVQTTALSIDTSQNVSIPNGDLAVTGDAIIDAVKVGAWSGGSTYKGIFHSSQSSSEYIIMNNDSHTFISASSGGSVYIRTGANDSTNQLIVSNGSNGLTWRGNKVFHAANLDITSDTSPVLGGNLSTNGNNIGFADDDQAIFGNGSDLTIKHNGTNSFIDNNTGDFYLQTTGSGDDIIIQSNDDILLEPQAGENGIKVIGNGAVEAYFNNVLKVKTQTDHINIGCNLSSNPFDYLRFGASLFGAADIAPHNAGSHTVGISFRTDSTADTTINPTEALRLSANGAFGPPSNLTQLLGASDMRLKKNIVTLDKGLSAVNSLRPVSFNWTDGFCDEQTETLYGFIAQEVQTIDSNLTYQFGSDGKVTFGETTIENALTVNEKFIIPMLVKAVQELTAKVTALES